MTPGGQIGRRAIARIAGPACALALLALAALAIPPSASGAAGRPLWTAIDPDGPYVGSDASIANRRIRDSGARYIRLLLNWRGVAPASEVPGFDASNPADPRYNWTAFDAELRPAVAAGLKPIIVIRSAPDYAEGSGPGRAGTVRPDPVEYALFARAVAQRYSGRFGGLPRVRYWQLWNEPNHFGFLTPQLEGGAIASAGHYRAMTNAFADAVHGVHADNKVIAGGLAPFHNDAPGLQVTSPLGFMRALLCMSGGRRPKATCSTRVKFDIWSHHPYTSGDARHHAAHPDDVSLPDLPEMRRLLSAAIRAGHVSSSRKPAFWVTEFSWDTNPPDPGAVPVQLHARWVAEALHTMWKAGVSLVTWYKLRDAAANGNSHSDTFESGLYFRCQTLSCDQPKPALGAFRFPFVAYRKGRRIEVWGRTPSSRRARVVVEQAAGRRWKRLAKLRADRYGIFSKRIRRSGRGDVRARVLKPAESSLPFSLKRPPDLPVNPFG